MTAPQNLPDDFIRETRRLMGEERFSLFMASFGQKPPVSIRINPRMSVECRVKSVEFATAPGNSPHDAVANSTLYTLHSKLETVPWCRDAYYLDHRPNFTFDPLLHAGCYYVQEAASMFLDTVLHQHLPSIPLTALDMCAAPGGKSTLLLAALPTESTLYSNEPVQRRASILLENITKWGHPRCIVTNNYPSDYCASKLTFDVILCDVPCSGEGMFRKDPLTIKEWSPQNVEKCWRLQRDIVTDAWQCLNPGGLLIYSTCTFNTKENEENIRWILDNFDAELLTVDTQPEWGIIGSLLPGFDAPVYRFIPGITRSEGLFMCVLRKSGAKIDNRKTVNLKHLNILSSPLDAQPSSTVVELPYPQAMAYLRGEALVLPPSTPRGIVSVSFMGHVLGQVKNIGNRANNLYPKEWRVRTTHIPNEYQPIL
jgi:16S rRNA C967 or C1407 C5-methylase (RsmB/RsmF family)